jgi:tetratricopeptide (TPR) repeat protein
MARGATQAHRKQRPKPDPKRKKAAPPSWEEQLFFSRLRRHAKIMYVLLAIVFAAGFVVLGVGSGSTGIGDLLQGKLFGGSGGSSTSSQIHDKQKAIARSPKNVSLYLDLAGLYQGEQTESQALATLTKAQKVAPRNVDVLHRIASISRARAARAGNDYQNVLNVYLSNTATPPGLDTSSQLGQALSSDPYSLALQTRLNEAYVRVTGAYTKVETIDKKAVDASRGTSNEQNALLQWASAAQSANDVTTAVTAYKRFLKLAPNNPNAPTVRQTLAQLEASVPRSQR